MHPVTSWLQTQDLPPTPNAARVELTLLLIQWILLLWYHVAKVNQIQTFPLLRRCVSLPSQLYGLSQRNQDLHLLGFCHAKIVPGEKCTGRYTFRNQNCTARYNFSCEKCTGLAKSVPGSEKVPLALTS